MRANTEFRKDDRVEFDAKGRTVYGVVVSEGETLRVVGDGGEFRYNIPAGRLRFSSKSVRRDKPHAIDAWQVTNYRDDTTDASECSSFSATITKHGVPLISVSNSGHGAPDRFSPLNGDYAAMQDFSLSVREWLADHDVAEGDILDEENFWIMYRANQAPYGVLAAEAIETYFGPSEEASEGLVEKIEHAPAVNIF